MPHVPRPSLARLNTTTSQSERITEKIPPNVCFHSEMRMRLDKVINICNGDAAQQMGAAEGGAVPLASAFLHANFNFAHRKILASEPNRKKSGTAFDCRVKGCICSIKKGGARRGLNYY